MIISEARKAIVLNLKNPGRVTNVIPSARVFMFRGQPVVAVPHRVDEVRVLRNLGFKAPSPILHHYRWPGRWAPFFAQKETAQFLTLHMRAFVLNDMGTGKTLAALWAFDYLRSIGKMQKLLVLSPLSTLERTWADEIFENFPHLRVAVVHGSRERRQKLLADDGYDIYVINHHGINVVEQEIIARKFDGMVVDEGAVFRNSNTKLWKTLYRISRVIKRIWWMTGTPTPNEPTDAWAQCRIMCPDRVPQYRGKFREMTMKPAGPFKWLPRPDATQTVFNAMQPAIRFRRDECMDLPPAIYQTREVEMTEDQKKAYKAMLTTLVMEHAAGQITAVNEAVKVGKLVQIACGVIYGPGGEEVVLPNAPRISALLEVIEQAHTKTIVFVPYKSVLRYVAEELRKHGLQVGEVSGDVSASKRGDVFSAFMNGAMDTIVAQPAAMSHGLTLTAANTIVWYGPTNSNETYEQANARITRPGQKHTQFIVHIEGTSVERGAYRRLQGRQKMQGLLLEAVEGSRKSVH